VKWTIGTLVIAFVSKKETATAFRLLRIRSTGFLRFGLLQAYNVLMLSASQTSEEAWVKEQVRESCLSWFYW